MKLMQLFKLLNLTAMILTFGSCSQTHNSEVSKYLLLDSRIIEEVTNAKLEVGTVVKHKANPLFEEEREWEMRFDNLYGNVIFDKEVKWLFEIGDSLFKFQQKEIAQLIAESIHKTFIPKLF